MTHSEQFARLDLEHVAVVDPGTAVAQVRARAITQDGLPLDVGHELLSLYVLRRVGGEWAISARQDTLVGSPDSS